MILKLNILIFTAVSAYMDLKWWKIKNVWLLIGAAAGVLYNFYAKDSPGLLKAALGMTIPFLLLWWLYSLKKMGAGDVKLFMVSGLFFGSERIWMFLLFSVIGGVLIFPVLAIKHRSVRAVLKHRIHVAVCAFISALCLVGGIYS